MRHCERLMRNPVVIVFSVCSQANMEHVAAVREPGGLQRPVQSCQIRFRPLTGCGSRRKAWRKWNHSVCAEREGSTDHRLRTWSRSAEWSYLIHTHALFTRLTGTQMCLIFTFVLDTRQMMVVGAFTFNATIIVKFMERRYKGVIVGDTMLEWQVLNLSQTRYPVLWCLFPFDQLLL